MAPSRSTRYRVRLGFTTIYLAKDFFIGFGLFLGIVVLGVLFFGYSIPYALSLSDADLAKTGVAGVGANMVSWSLRPLIVLTVVLFCTTEGLLLFLLTADPGIVEEPEWIAAGGERPPNSDVHMCPICFVWIEGFDHHCGILGACIGSKTMPIFNVFLMSAWTLLLSGIAFVLAPLLAVAHGRGELLVWIPPFPVLATAAVTVAAIYLGSYTFLLWGWYTNMACRGQFSLHRRRRILGQAEENPNCAALPKKYDLSRPCKWSYFTEMLSELRHAQMAIA